MADISTELQAIQEAVYGEQVRGAIVDALEAMNENAEAAEAWATGGSGGTAGAQNNAKYYAEQAAQSASAFDVDDTLSIEGKAADAAATGNVNNRAVKFQRLLAATDDLFALLDIGTYIAPTYAIAAALNENGNSPTVIPFIVTIFGRQIGTTANAHKCAILINAEKNIWISYKTSNSDAWSPWTSLAKGDSVTALGATVSELQTAVSEQKKYFQEIIGGVPLNIDDGVVIAGYISNGKLNSDTGATSMRQFETNGEWKTLYVTAKSDQSAIVVFLTDTLEGLDYGDDVPQTEDGFFTVNAGTSAALDVPEDAAYVSILKYRKNITRTPQEMSVLLDKNLEQSIIDLENGVSGGITEYQASGYTSRNGFITSANVWSSVSSAKHSVIPLTEEKVVKITAGTHNSVIAFLTDATVVSGQTPAFADGEDGRRVISANETVYLFVPKDAKYLYFYRGETGSGWPNIPSSMIGYSFVLDAEILSAVVNAGIAKVELPEQDEIRDVPKNQGVRNMYKKIHQLLDIAYTTTADIISRDMPEGDYQGVVYSGTADKAHYIGYNVSMRSYMTAVHNPYSGFYTEDTEEYDPSTGTGNVSAYENVTYHGSNSSTPLGTVCAPFVAYVLGMPIKWENHAWPYLASIGVLEKIADQSYTGVELGDTIYIRGHVSIVSDIWRDARGVPTHITVSESWGPRGRERRMTPGAFTAYMNDGRTIYRYRDLYKNLSYKADEFIAVDGEPEPEPYVYNEDICPYLGDYSVYNEGDLIAICYTKGTYSNMVISKGDAVAVTVQLPIDDNAHLVDLRPFNLPAGHYSARLTGSSGSSEACYFDVLNLPITVTENGDNITVTFDPAKHPRYAQVCSLTGAAKCVVELTDADKTAGTKTFNVRDLVEAQNSSVSADSYYMIVMYDVTDPAGYELVRATDFVPLTWTE